MCVHRRFLHCVALEAQIVAKVWAIARKYMVQPTGASRLPILPVWFLLSDLSDALADQALNSKCEIEQSSCNSP